MTLAHLISDPSIALDRRFGSLLRAFADVALEPLRGNFVLDDALHLVGRELCNLLEVRRCSVYLRCDDGTFAARAGSLLGEDIRDQIGSMVAGLEGDGFTREIVRTKAPLLIKDAPHDPRTIRQSMVRWNVRDILGVPLVVEGTVIGLIFVDNADEPHEYDKEEIAVAQAFASLAAVAVRHGWLHSQIEERARVVDLQRRLLEQLAETDSRLTRAVLDGADLPTLLKLICDLVGKPVLVYNSRLELMAWSAPPGLELAQAPEFSSKTAQNQWLRRTLAELRGGSRSTALIPPTPQLGVPFRQLMSPLTIDGRSAGFLDIVELGSSLSTFDTKVLERAAVAVSLQILTEHRQTEAEGQAQQDFLADLFHGLRSSDQLRRRARLYGIDPDRPQLVVRVAYEEAADATTGSHRRTESQRVLAELIGSSTTLLSTGLPGADLFLVELDSTDAALTLEQKLDEGFPKLRELQARYVLVSGACKDLEALPTAAARLRDLAEVLSSADAPSQLVITRKLRLVHLVSGARRIHEARDFAVTLLAPLSESDRKAGRGPLIGTLRAYFDNDGNVRATSKELGVHENTVRYRLSRIHELAGINADSLDDLLDAQFSLQLLDLLGEHAPAPKPAPGPDVA